MGSGRRRGPPKGAAEVTGRQVLDERDGRRIEVDPVRREVDIGGLRISYDTIWKLREHFRSEGELKLTDDGLTYPCEWCRERYERPLREVSRRSLNSLKYHDNCRARVLSLRSYVRTAFPAETSELGAEEIASSIRAKKGTRLSARKMEEYLERLEVVERTKAGLYRLRR